MSRRKDRKVGIVNLAIMGVDITGTYPVTLIAEVRGDEGREYILHLSPQVIAQINDMHEAVRTAEPLNPDFPQTEEDAKLCVHRNQVWFGNECGECDMNGHYVWLNEESA